MLVVPTVLMIEMHKFNIGKKIDSIDATIELGRLNFDCRINFFKQNSKLK